MTGYGNAGALDRSGLGCQVDQFAPPPDPAPVLDRRNLLRQPVATAA